MKQKLALLFLRYSLGVSYLSAVADRLGFWGTPGAPNVGWGNFENFTKYTATLNWFMPDALIPFTAWSATLLEIVLGVLLMVGFKLKETAFMSGILLALFFITMTISLGLKAPLDYSVFTACAASFLLSTLGDRHETTTHKS